MEYKFSDDYHYHPEVDIFIIKQNTIEQQAVAQLETSKAI